ncbi:putative reverse transcriptase domain-containing protein, partial [Tanacetum coccineum]
MRQRRWIELFSDYDCEISYHPGKANVVADALTAQKEAFEAVNALAEILRRLDKQMERWSDEVWPSGLLQQPEIPDWKWERITMDFVTKLPMTSSRHDAIWANIDQLTKYAYFLPMREDYKMD